MFRHTLLAALLLLCTSQTADTTAARRLLHEARALLDSAQLDQALLRSQAAVEQAPPDSDLAAECLLALGDVFAEQARWPAAEQQYRAALHFLEKKHGPRHVLTALALNGLGEIFYKKNDIAQAEAHHQRALLARQQMHGEQHESVADSYNNLGNCAAARGNWGEAMSLHRTALRIRQQALPARHPDLATSHNNVGNCLLLAGDPTGALPAFEAALRIRQQAFGPQHPKTAQVLNNLGNCCAALGQRLRAVAYYRLALDIRRRQLGEQHPSLAPPLENLGDLCSESGDHIAALDFYRQAYALRAGAEGAATQPTAVLRHKIGLCHQYEGSYAAALAHHEAAAQTLQPLLGEASPILASLWNNLGNCYAAQRDFPQAMRHYRQAEKAMTQAIRAGGPQSGETKNTEIALIFNNLGQCCLQTNRPSEALAFFVKTENALSEHPAPELADCLKNQALALERLDRWPQAQQALARAQRCAALSDSAAVMELRMAEGAMRSRRGLHLNDAPLLRQSLSLLSAALRLSDSLRLGLSAPASRQQWAERQYPALAAAVEAGFRLWSITAEEVFLEKALGFAERSRSLQLLDHLRHEQAERFAGIPDSLLEQERHWGEELNRCEKIRRAATESGDVEEARAAAVAIAEARQRLAETARRMEQLSPNFGRMRRAAGGVSLADLRRLVLRGGRRALLEYFRTDDALFAFVLTQQRVHALRLPADTSLDAQVRIFRRSVEAYPAATGAAAAALSEQYARAAHGIFEKIIAPVQAALPLPQEWTVVPDGVLSYLPFEALLSELPADFQQFKSHRYLLREAQIAYAYSATQLLELSSAPPERAARPLLAMAPDFAGSAWPPLSHSQAEAAAAAELLGGDALLGGAATAAAFQQEAGKYRVLHLATHGQASATLGERSHLVFSPTGQGGGEPLVYARDLYLMRLRAELVVLSACETGDGEHRWGEGVVGLTKGFFSAGARSAVATLWRVDDARNADLVLRFFQKLKNGAAKDAALREAKLDYLLARPHDEAHPAYWAAALMHGDVPALDWGGGGGAGCWRWLGLLAAAAAGYWWWRRRR
jgi:CHAT domain-containing protein/Tfp pilus assembly protein PilF